MNSNFDVLGEPSVEVSWCALVKLSSRRTVTGEKLKNERRFAGSVLLSAA